MHRYSVRVYRLDYRQYILCSVYNVVCRVKAGAATQRRASEGYKGIAPPLSTPLCLHLTAPAPTLAERITQACQVGREKRVGI